MPVLTSFGDILWCDFGKPGKNSPGYRRYVLQIGESNDEHIPVMIMSSRPFIRSRFLIAVFPIKAPMQFICVDKVFYVKPEKILRRFGKLNRRMLKEALENNGIPRLYIGDDRNHPEQAEGDKPE